jgi:hypothetical protein
LIIPHNKYQETPEDSSPAGEHVPNPIRGTTLDPDPMDEPITDNKTLNNKKSKETSSGEPLLKTFKKCSKIKLSETTTCLKAEKKENTIKLLNPIKTLSKTSLMSPNSSKAPTHITSVQDNPTITPEDPDPIDAWSFPNLKNPANNSPNNNFPVWERNPKFMNPNLMIKNPLHNKSVTICAPVTKIRPTARIVQPRKLKQKILGSVTDVPSTWPVFNVIMKSVGLPNVISASLRGESSSVMGDLSVLYARTLTLWELLFWMKKNWLKSTSEW